MRALIAVGLIIGYAWLIWAIVHGGSKRAAVTHVPVTHASPNVYGGGYMEVQPNTGSGTITRVEGFEFVDTPTVHHGSRILGGKEQGQ